MRFCYGYVFHGGVFGPGTDPAASYVARLLGVLCYLDAIPVCIAGAGAGGKN